MPVSGNRGTSPISIISGMLLVLLRLVSQSEKVMGTRLRVTPICFSSDWKSVASWVNSARAGWGQLRGDVRCPVAQVGRLGRTVVHLLDLHAGGLRLVIGEVLGPAVDGDIGQGVRGAEGVGAAARVVVGQPALPVVGALVLL